MTSTTASRRSIVNRSPVYYGWVIWIVATIGMSASMPGQTANVSLFVNQWIGEFGLEGRGTISLLYGVGTFIASLTLTFVGNRVDKHGARTMAIIIAILFALALVYMALVQNLLMLMFGFILIRGLGQGSTTLVHTIAIANWFQRMRGRMMAFALIGFSLFQRIYLPFVQQTLETVNWRTVWLLLALGIVLLVVPLAGSLLREKPEHFGLRPDGDGTLPEDSEDTAPSAAQSTTEENYSLREAAQLPIFWVFLVGGMMSPAFVTGIIFHQESLFGIGGYNAQIAAETVANALLLSSVSTLITGYLVDRIRPNWVRAMELLALAILMVSSAFLGRSPLILPLWTVTLGIVMGTGGVFNGAVWANLFGRAHLGEINGFVSTMTVLGTSLGPYILAISYDAVGNYALSLYIGAAVALIPMLAGVFLTKPRRR